MRRFGLWLAILGTALAIQGCWEDGGDQLTLLGDGGCRTADGGDGAPDYLSGLSLDQCKAQCFDGDGSCTAVEYNTNNSACEIHAAAITTFAEVDGVACYVRQ